MDEVIGRKNEISEIEKRYNSKKSEFVAVYGRRRVGKTYLIKEMFSNKYTFQVTGISRAKLGGQLSNFYFALIHFCPALSDEKRPKSWADAFFLLQKCIEKSSQKRKVIFIDELPWMDTPRSDFISAMEHFWNGWASHRKDIFLIVCGSATSWMINELILNHGGLHNRVTERIQLEPFTLGETEAFLKSKGAVYDRYQIVQLYMAMGGIPFYLEAIDPSKSIAQNFDRIFFSHTGLLRNEFANLFQSLFKKGERHKAVVEVFAKKGKGLSRGALCKASRLPNGGTFTKILEELCLCGFLRKFQPFGKKNRGSLYQLIDPYCLFYMKFIKNSKAVGEGAWSSRTDHPSWRAWSGYAFENICFYHINQIKKGLGIGAVFTEISSWKSQESEAGGQIDLVIDRRDRTINVCEIKFSHEPFSISKAYSQKLSQRLNTFRQESKTSKTIFLTFITPMGLKKNQYANSLVQSDLTFEALFDD